MTQNQSRLGKFIAEYLVFFAVHVNKKKLEKLKQQNKSVYKLKAIKWGLFQNIIVRVAITVAPKVYTASVATLCRLIKTNNWINPDN